jgi:hypothetical protein
LALRDGTMRTPGMRRKWETTGGTFDARDWARMADLDGADPGFRRHVRSIAATYARFCASADSRPGPQHLPPTWASAWKTELGTERARDRIAWTVRRVARAWDRILDPSDATGIDHDGSLKAFAESGKPWARDGVLVDEAQDLAPVVVAMLAKVGVQRIVVGDPAQRIYAWRGAVDAMAAMPDPTLPLDRSFRFGPSIAAVARSILGVLDPTGDLVGFGPNDTVTTDPPPPHARKTILCRTNAGIVEAVAAHAGRRIALAAGGGLATGDLARAYGTWSKRDTSDGRAAWSAWVAAAEEHAGQERTLLKIVETHRHAVPALLETLGAASRTDEEDAEIVITTIHRSKGREWDDVEIWHDLARVPTSRRALVRDPDVESAKAEARLAYVACTRARRTLWIGRLGDDLRDTWASASGHG